MSKVLKKITAVALSAVIASCAFGVGVSAYEAVGDWNINFMNHAPANQPGLTPSCQSEIPVYGGGYQTYCASISGSNDRYVKVTAEGISDFRITTTGYSNVVRCVPSGYTITFNFYGIGGTSCVANGTVGYNK